MYRCINNKPPRSVSVRMLKEPRQQDSLFVTARGCPFNPQESRVQSRHISATPKKLLPSIPKGKRLPTAYDNAIFS